MQKLFYAIAFFGAVAVGVIDASPLWIRLIALLNFFGIFLNPVLSSRMQNQIDKATDKEELGGVTNTFISSYIYSVFLVSLYYGVGLLIGWLIN